MPSPSNLARQTADVPNNRLGRVHCGDVKAARLGWNPIVKSAIGSLWKPYSSPVPPWLSSWVRCQTGAVSDARFPFAATLFFVAEEE